MAHPTCTPCKKSPSFKCQRCKNKFCDEHAADKIDQWGQRTLPYRLCYGCHEEFLYWLYTTKWKNPIKSLCCLVGGVHDCPYCRKKFCEKHKHSLQECLAWLKWKWSPRRTDVTLPCCLTLKGQRTFRCSKCKFPSCGKHKAPTPSSWHREQVCQLCSYVFPA